MDGWIIWGAKGLLTLSHFSAALLYPVFLNIFFYHKYGLQKTPKTFSVKKIFYIDFLLFKFPLRSLLNIDDTDQYWIIPILEMTHKKASKLYWSLLDDFLASLTRVFRNTLCLQFLHTRFFSTTRLHTETNTLKMDFRYFWTQRRRVASQTVSLPLTCFLCQWLETQYHKQIGLAYSCSSWQQKWPLSFCIEWRWLDLSNDH